MNEIIKIAVLGGTGKSGNFLVKTLLEENFKVKLLVRNPEKVKLFGEGPEIIIGDVLNPLSIEFLLQGCNAVISCLGLGIPSSAPNIFSNATTNLIGCMNEAGITRYIATSGLNVDTLFDKKGIITKSSTDWMYQNFPISTADRQREYELLRESNLDWTLVRLPLIELTEEKAEIEVSLEDCVGRKISAKSLAHFLIRQLEDRSFIKKAPFVSNK